MPGKISITSDMQMTPPLWQKVSGPITSWEIDGETVEIVSDFIFGGSKITADGVRAMKLKDAYSLEGKL